MCVCVCMRACVCVCVCACAHVCVYRVFCFDLLVIVNQPS